MENFPHLVDYTSLELVSGISNYRCDELSLISIDNGDISWSDVLKRAPLASSIAPFISYAFFLSMSSSKIAITMIADDKPMQPGSY